MKVSFEGFGKFDSDDMFGEREIFGSGECFFLIIVIIIRNLKILIEIHS